MSVGKEDLQRIEVKVDKVIEVNNRQDVHLAKLSTIAEQNKVILDEHMARTAANERHIKMTEERTFKLETKLEKHLSFLTGVIKVFSVLVTVVGVLGGLAKMGVISF